MRVFGAHGVAFWSPLAALGRLWAPFRRPSGILDVIFSQLFPTLILNGFLDGFFMVLGSIWESIFDVFLRFLLFDTFLREVSLT